MMFKATTVIALAAALVSNAQAAAVDGASGLNARQDPVCPTGGQACGWFLLDHGCIPNRGVLDAIPHNNSNVFNSIWNVENSQPVSWVTECTTGCSNIGGRPQTECN